MTAPSSTAVSAAAAATPAAPGSPSRAAGAATAQPVQFLSGLQGPVRKLQEDLLAEKARREQTEATVRSLKTKLLQAKHVWKQERANRLEAERKLEVRIGGVGARVRPFSEATALSYPPSNSHAAARYPAECHGHCAPQHCGRARTPGRFQVC